MSDPPWPSDGASMDLSADNRVKKSTTCSQSRESRTSERQYEEDPDLRQEQHLSDQLFLKQKIQMLRQQSQDLVQTLLQTKQLQGNQTRTPEQDQPLDCSTPNRHDLLDNATAERHQPENYRTPDRHEQGGNPTLDRHQPLHFLSANRHQSLEHLTPDRHQPQAFIILDRYQPPNLRTQDIHQPLELPTLNRHYPQDYPTANGYQSQNNLTQDRYHPWDHRTLDKHQPQDDTTVDRLQPQDHLTPDRHWPLAFSTPDRNRPRNYPTSFIHQQQDFPTVDRHQPQNCPTLNRYHSLDYPNTDGHQLRGPDKPALQQHDIQDLPGLLALQNELQKLPPHVFQNLLQNLGYQLAVQKNPQQDLEDMLEISLKPRRKSVPCVINLGHQLQDAQDTSKQKHQSCNIPDEVLQRSQLQHLKDKQAEHCCQQEGQRYQPPLQKNQLQLILNAPGLQIHPQQGLLNAEVSCGHQLQDFSGLALQNNLPQDVHPKHHIESPKRTRTTEVIGEGHPVPGSLAMESVRTASPIPSLALSPDITGLRSNSGLKYQMTSQPSVNRVIPVPEQLTVSSVTATSAILSWQVSPEMQQTPHRFQVSYQSELMERKSIIAESCSTTITDLKPGTEYNVTVSTQLNHGGKSQPAYFNVKTEIPAPEQLTVSLVTTTSAILSWQVSPEMQQTPHRFQVSFQSELMEQKSIITESCSTTITGLKPGTEYNVTVSTQLQHGGTSQPATVKMTTEIPAPEQLTVSSVTATSAILSWQVSPEMQQTPHRFQVSYQSELMEQKSIIAESCSTTITDLKPGTEYNVTVSTELNHGGKSQPAYFDVKTEIPAPEQLTVSLVTTTSAILSWQVSPELQQTPHRFQVSYQSELMEQKSIIAESCSTTITDLKPGTEYNVTVSTQLQHGGTSQPATVKMTTEIPAPEQLTVSSVTATSAILSWQVSPEMQQTPHRFQVSYQSELMEQKSIIAESCSTTITDLKPGTEYNVTVSTELNHGGKSQPAYFDVKTEIPAPEQLTVSSVTATSAILSWQVSPEMQQTPHRFQVSYQSELMEQKSIITESCSTTITGLKPGSEYNVTVSTQLQHGGTSQPATVKMTTEIPAPEQLTVSSVTATSAILSWQVSPEMQQTPHRFQVSYQSELMEQKSIIAESCSTTITDLKPGTEYNVTVSTELNHGGKSQPAYFDVKTEIHAPEQLTVNLVTTTSAILSWQVSPEMQQTPHRFQVSDQSELMEQKSIIAESCSTTITGLKPGTEYNVTVSTQLQHGGMSQPATVKMTTEIPAPEQLTVSSVTATSIILSWQVSPEIQQTPHRFQVSYQSELMEQKSIIAESRSTIITDLKPGTEYNVTVSTELNHGGKSQPAYFDVKTEIPAPEQLTVSLVTTTSAILSWQVSPEMQQTPHRFQVSYQSELMEQKSIIAESCSTTITDLKPGTEYNVTVSTQLQHGGTSQPATVKMTTEIPAPEQLTVSSVTATSLILSWQVSPEMQQTPHRFQVSYQSELMEQKSIIAESCSTTITDLKPGTEYNVTVSTELNHGGKSQPAYFDVKTEIPAPEQLTVSLVTTTSAILSWQVSPEMQQTPHRFQVSYQSELMEQKSIIAESCSTTITDLKPGTEYNVTVSTQLQHGGTSQPATVKMTTEIPAPEQLTVSSVTATSLILSWQVSPEMQQTPHRFQVSYQSELMEQKSIIAESCSTTITDLKPGTEYNVTVSTELNHGGKSQPAYFDVKTEIPAPEQLTVSLVTTTSAILSWQVSPEMQQTPHRFQVSYQSELMEQKSIIAESCSTTITDLKPGTEYNVTVSTQLQHGGTSQPATVKMTTEIPAPEQLTVSSVTATSAILSWQVSPEMQQTPHRFQVSYQSELMEQKSIIAESCSTIITDLKPGTEYNITVSTELNHGGKSQPAYFDVKTEIPAPEQLTVSSVTATSAILSWQVSPEMQQTPHRFQVSYQSELMEQKSIIAESCSTTITDLKPGTEYNVTVSTELNHGGKSQPACFDVKTEIPAPEQLTVSLVTTTSAILSWQVSPEMQQTPHRFQVSYQSELMEQKSIIAESCSTTITDLKPGTEYNVTVSTQLQHGGTSQPATVKMTTEIPAPEQLIVSSVTATSLILSWQVSPEMQQTPHRFQVSYQSELMEQKSIIAESCSTIITDLKPGTEYNITVSTELNHGGKSQPAYFDVKTEIPAPEQLTVSSVTATSAILSWQVSPEMQQTPHRFQVSYQSELMEQKSIIAESCSTTITDLKPGTEYNVTVSTELNHGGKSQPACFDVKTEISAPEQLTVSLVTTTSAILSWQVSPEMQQTPHRFQVSYQSELMEQKSIIAESCSTTITDLKPGTEYNVTVSTQLQHGGTSQPATVTMTTEIPAPEQLIVSSVTATSLILSWQVSPEMQQTPHRFQVSYQSELMEQKSIIAESCSTIITDLKPGTEYNITVSTELNHGGKSQPAYFDVKTEIPAPEQLTVSLVTTTSAILSWQVSPEMQQTPHRFQVSYQSELMEQKSIIAESCSTTITDLKPGTEYNVTVSTQLQHGGTSQPATVKMTTEIPAPEQLIVSSVTATSAILSWQVSPEMQQTPHRFQVSYQSELMEQKSIIAESCSTIITDLKPGTEYNITVSTELNHGGKSQPAYFDVKTEIPAPEQLTVSSVTATSAILSWQVSPEMQQTPHRFQVSYQSELMEQKSIIAESCSTTITDLKPGTEYNVTVSTELNHGGKSQPACFDVKTEIPSPEQLTVSLVTTTSAILSWQVSPEMQQTPHRFQVSYQSELMEQKSIITESCSTTITGLKPGTEYNVTVSTQLQHGGTSQPATVKMTTEIPAPEQLTVNSVTATSAILSWQVSPEMQQTPHRFQVSYQSELMEQKSIITESCSTTITGLKPGTEYNVTVSTQLQHGGTSQPATVKMTTEIPAPEQLTVSSVTATSAILSWQVSPEMQQTPHRFQVSYQSELMEQKSIIAESCSTTITDLKPGTEYNVTVSTQLQHGGTSQPATVKMTTEIPAPEQLTLSLVTTTSAILSWQVSPEMQQTPHRFQVSYQSELMEQKSIITESCSTTITGLKPGTEYNVTVSTQLQHGGTSQPATVKMTTEIPAPEQLTVSSVTATSIILSWQVSPEMQQTPHRFQVSYQSELMEQKSIIAESCSTTITDLKPGTEYNVTVSTELNHGGKSQPAYFDVKTEIPSPEQLTVSLVTTTSAILSWQVSPEMQQTPHRFQVSYQSELMEQKSIITESCSTTITGLKPGTEYNVTVSTQLQHGGTSQPATVKMTTEIPAPEQLTVSSVTATSAILSWQVSPEMQQTPHRFQVSYQSELMEQKSIITESCSMTITGLKPGTEYNVTVSTQLQHGGTSQPATVKMTTEIPAPEQLTVSSVTATSAILSWQVSPEMQQTPHRFQVSYQSELMEQKSIIAESCSTTITDLKPGTEYNVTVSTQLQHGGTSQPATVKMTTEIPAPEQLTVSSVTATSAILSWQVSPEMQQTPHKFQVSYQSELMERKSIIAESCSMTITGLKPGTEYNVTVSTQLKHGGKSQPAYFNIKTGVGLADLLSTLGLKNLHGGKLTLNRVLEINSNTVTDKPAESLEHLPWIFLKKLMMSNLNARNVKCVSQNFDEGNGPLADSHADGINPLDVITAVLHCADPFLQQEMVSKMAMCQFAVPLLMPNIDSGQSTLMLWALRDIVKKYRHLSSADAKTFVEGRIVQIDMPVISFVRLGQCSLSKSQTLNKLLSNPHQHNETFVHYDMEGGDVPRKIADGLVEISWYLPCGNNNIDMFTQPVAIANLRGDARTFEAQMSFLLQISTAVFIFCDDLESDLSILTSREIKAKLFLVISSQSETSHRETLNATCRKHNFAFNNVIVKKKQSDADFVRVLRSNVTQAIEKNPMKTTIEDIAAVASQVRILVDEHYDECAKGKLIAKEITGDITDVVRFKENQLPLHGKTWKEISQLEKEICRMKKAGKDIEQYRCSLQNKEKELRKIQKQTSMSDAMKKFITGISQSRTQRLYFLKWLQIQLDNCSRQNLSSLREKYKECCQSASEEIEQMAHLDEQISNCSLGPEHFFRELGQIYEAASFPPLNDPARHQYQDLPKLCAQMLLDGFPIELVDGDASNIPLKWISEVLTQLHVMVDNNSRILVLTVLGVQSTGKSTLLNTMFGVQFAVSSGRCTRGAFMLLTKVSEEYKPQLKCDFIMIIDTEGLKSPELAALDTSYEHDNELATLVIGLSDVTIINIAMENSTEMKDILQIAVHAFLRMKEVGKKPRCLFVHQNVSDMAAHDSNLRDRKKLVEQLDEMTRAAARMEKKKAHTKFTDVMEYDPDRNTHYIPGLWHGTPPMAPVNAGYSEAVYALKKSLISYFQMCHFQGNDVKKFLEWTTNLWDAVKFENFIFSFRNSLVADAYANLCMEYNRWEWEFQKTMNSWMVSKETYISNFGVIDNHVQKNNHLRGELRNLLKEASMKVSQEEEKMLQQLEKYFERKDSHVALVEKYKADFKTSAQSLRRETEASIKYSLQRAVEIKEGMEKVNAIKSTQAEMIERKVQELLKACQKKNAALSDYEIEREFEDMWKTTVEELSVSLPKQDVVQETLHELKLHFETKTGAVKKAINKEDFEKSGQTGFAVNCHWWENTKAMFVGIVRHGELNRVAREIQELCDKIIHDCLVNVSGIVKAKNDFHKTYMKEILNKIDEGIKEGQKKFNINEQCESSLKFHICYKAAVEFQKMHYRFIDDNDPKNCLEKSKSKFLEEFKDLYYERDQCQKKVAEFTESCLKPAVRCYVIKNLGPDIADDMMTGDAGQNYSTRTNFQYALLKQLLEKNDFKEFQKYTRKYRHFVEEWILQDIVGKFSDEKMATMKKKHLSRIIAKITTVISESIEKVGDNTEMKNFIQSFCKSLGEQLTFQKDGIDSFLILNNANTLQFAKYLCDGLENMETSLTEEYSKPENIEETIKGLPFKPHDLLFKRLCGCGEQCPFCKTPCEAGGLDHCTHFSSMHRSEALGGYRWLRSGKLVIEICTTSVISDNTFRSAETNGEYHPFKNYKEIYPDWEITGDPSTESSDYWKYVLKTFNEDFAKFDSCKPADIPADWKSLTDHDAKISLKKAFRKEENLVQ